MSTATAADYSTTTVANGLYYPLAGNPSGFLTSAPVTSVAGRTGAITLSNTDISGLGTMAVETATNYLTTASASATYFTIASAANKADLASPTFTGTVTIPSGAAISGYLTTTAGDAAYYPLASNPAGYLTSAPVTSVAGRTGAITLANTDISGLGTMSTATASDYSTTTVADGLYYPLASNPAGYLTSAPVSSVAGRTGAVTLAVADVSGAAAIDSQAFTGTPSLPTGTTAVTQTLADNSTKLATTAYVDGSIPANSVKAWVNFNGTGTVAIRASMNVSSITDNSTGNYTINFTTALADANYAMVGSGTAATDGTNIDVGFFAATTNFTPSTKTTSAARIIVTRGSLTVTDVADIGVAFFR
tara:strand:+ start:185 stop:1270 length:1086 start_codon:yes stop_codon:yes gene_type:complete